MDKAVKSNIKNMLGFRELGLESLHLGNSLVCDTKKIKEFEKLKDKV